MNSESPKEAGETWAKERASLNQLLKIERQAPITAALFKADFNREELLHFVRTWVDGRYSHAYQFIEGYFPRVLQNDNELCSTRDIEEFFGAARAVFVTTSNEITDHSRVN